MVKLLHNPNFHVGIPNKLGQTPISLAAENMYAPIVKFLADQGGDSDVTDHNELGPLIFAPRHSHTKAIHEQLLQVAVEKL